MDPNENGYLARHLQNPFYYNFYNPNVYPTFSYDYTQPPQFILPPATISMPDR